MPTSESVKNPVRSVEELQERIKFQNGEHGDDMLSLYDAMDRYGVSRSALRRAVIEKKMNGVWVGGLSRKVLYMTRSDIIEYLSLPMSAMQGRHPVPWRVQDRVKAETVASSRKG